MLLENKNAIIYGAGGNIGGAVARAFAREGAKVFLAGRALAKLDTVAQEIFAPGGNGRDGASRRSRRAGRREARRRRGPEGGDIEVSFNAVGTAIRSLPTFARQKQRWKSENPRLPVTFQLGVIVRFSAFGSYGDLNMLRVINGREYSDSPRLQKITL